MKSCEDEKYRSESSKSSQGEQCSNITQSTFDQLAWVPLKKEGLLWRKQEVENTSTGPSSSI